MSVKKTSGTAWSEVTLGDILSGDSEVLKSLHRIERYLQIEAEYREELRPGVTSDKLKKEVEKLAKERGE